MAGEEELEALLGVAKHGLGELLDGECTIQLGVGAGALPESEPEWIPSEGLPNEVALGLSGPPAMM